MGSELPSGWSIANLGALGDGSVGLQTGPFGSQLHKFDYVDIGVPVVMPKDIIDGKITDETIARIPPSKASHLSKHQVRRGDILFGRRGDIGRCGLVTAREEGWLCGTGCLRARLTGAVLPEFLIHELRSKKVVQYLNEHAVGQTMLNLNTKILAAVPIRVPPIGEQRKIAAILSSVDEAIEKTQAVIDQVQVVKKGLMQELLTRGIPGRHTRFKQTEIGEVPADWDVSLLGEVGTVQTGLAKNKNNTGLVEVYYLRVANVQDGFLDLAEMKTLKVSEHAIERYALRCGDVLFAEGGDADKVGRGAVWHGQVQPCLHQNHVFVVRTDTRRILPEFLSLYRSSARGKAYFFDAAKQTTNLASINTQQLKAFPLVLPPIDEQLHIVAVEATFDERMRAERAKLVGMRRVKDGLLSCLLTGELRVQPEAEAQ